MKKWIHHTVLLLLCGSLILTQTGCFLGMLFYRENQSKTIYKSPVHEGRYYRIRGETLSHCGCSTVYAEIFQDGYRVAKIVYAGYNNTPGFKEEYLRSPMGNLEKTNHYTLVDNSSGLFPIPAEDSLIIHQMDSLSYLHNPKQALVYPIPHKKWMGMR